MKKLLLLYLLSFAIVMIANGADMDCNHQDKEWGETYCDYIKEIKKSGSIEAEGECGVEQFDFEYIKRLTRLEELYLKKFQELRVLPALRLEELDLKDIFDFESLRYIKRKAAIMLSPDKDWNQRNSQDKDDAQKMSRELHDLGEYFTDIDKKRKAESGKLDPKEWFNQYRYSVQEYERLHTATKATRAIFKKCYKKAVGARGKIINDKENSKFRKLNGRGIKQKAFTMIREKVIQKAFEVFDKAAGTALETVFGPNYVENAINGVTESLKTPTKVMKGQDELFTDKSRPYVLILNNLYRENVTLEYMGFRSKSGGQYSFTNENSHEDELEDYKIQYKQRAHVQYSEKIWYHFSGVSGNAQLLYYDDDKTFKKFLNVYVENPAIGGRKCCVEILDYSDYSKNYDSGAICGTEQRFKKPRKLEGSADRSALISMVPATMKVEGKEIFTCMMTLASTKASKRKYYKAKRLEEEMQQEKKIQQEKEKQAVLSDAGVDFEKKDKTSAVPSKPSKASRKNLKHALKGAAPAETTTEDNTSSSAENEATPTTSKREPQQATRSIIQPLEYKTKKEPLITPRTKIPDVMALPSTSVQAEKESKVEKNTQLVVVNSTENPRKKKNNKSPKPHPEGRRKGPFSHGLSFWTVQGKVCPLDERKKYWSLTPEKRTEWARNVLDDELWRKWPDFVIE